MTITAPVWHHERIPARDVTTAHRLAGPNNTTFPVVGRQLTHNGAREFVRVEYTATDGTTAWVCFPGDELVAVTGGFLEQDAQTLLAEHGHVPSPTARAHQQAQIADAFDTLRAARILAELLARAADTWACHEGRRDEELARVEAFGGTEWLAKATAELGGTDNAVQIAHSARKDALDRQAVTR